MYFYDNLFRYLMPCFMIFYFYFLSMICCNSAFEQGNLDLWRVINVLLLLLLRLNIFNVGILYFDRTEHYIYLTYAFRHTRT